MQNQNKKFFKAVCKCGHVGKQHYVPVQFAVCAESAKEAAKQARNFPRVKHDHKDAILKVIEISLDQFNELKEINNNDPYLKCHSRKEQNLTCDLVDRLEIDHHNKRASYNKEDRIEKVKCKLKKYKAMMQTNWEDECYEYCY